MLKKIVSSIRVIEIFLLIIAYILGCTICKYLGHLISWSGITNGFLVLASMTLGFKFLGNYIYRNAANLTTRIQQSEGNGKKNTEIQDVGNLYLLIGVAFFAIGVIPVITLIRSHAFNLVNLTILSLGIFILGMLELFREQTATWGLMEVFKSFFYANIVPAFAYSLQVGTIHRFVFLLTFPLFFLFLSQFIILNLPAAQEVSDETSAHLISRFGTFTVLRIHNVSLLMGFLFFLLGTFFEVPWRIIWPPLVMIPVGIVQIWHINQILAGKKPNFRVMEFTAVSVAFFCTYFLILGLWLK